jgi:N-formylglutamate amidohydrolase
VINLSPLQRAGVLSLQVGEGDPVPVVFDSPHSGVAYPADFDHAAPRDQVRTAEDTYVDELYAAAPAHGAALLCALFPRSYIDPNRAETDLDVGLIDGAWPHAAEPGPKTRLGMGLVRSMAVPDLPMYARKLSVAEVERRIADYYRPYHEALRRALDDAHRRFGVAWHLNCHSMPHLATTMSPDPAGTPRADFVLGDRGGTTCDHEFTTAVAQALTGMGYEVKINDPYQGVELVRRYSDPAHARHSLQIEVNRRLYMDETTFEKTDGFAKLQRDITHLIQEIRRYAVLKVAR